MLSLFSASSAFSGARVALEPSVLPHSAATSSWVREEKPNPNLEFNLPVALKIDDAPRAALEKIFWEVSNPKHPKYGQYKTNAELAQILAVPASRIERVTSFFDKAGARYTLHPHKDSLNIQMSVWALEAALQVGRSPLSPPLPFPSLGISAARPHRAALD